MVTEQPIVGTGVEYKAALTQASWSYKRIRHRCLGNRGRIVRTDEGRKTVYHLIKFKRSSRAPA